MAYSDRTLRRLINKAGVPFDHVTSILGFFSLSLTPRLKQKLDILPNVAISHNDSNLHELTRTVLSWIQISHCQVQYWHWATGIHSLRRTIQKILESHMRSQNVLTAKIGICCLKQAMQTSRL